MIEIAEAELGAPDSPNKFTMELYAIDGYPGGGYGYPWCAAFVSWCSKKDGVSSENVELQSASVYWIRKYFEDKTKGTRFEKGKDFGGTYVPKTGDYIFFDWGGNASGFDHIGLVKSSDGTKAYTVEGNSSNTVRNKEYDINSKKIVGYGVWE